MAFEKVSTQALLDGCYRKENAWNIISNYSRYPDIMDNVDKVEITEREGDGGISRWFITVEEAPLAWVEKDLFNTQNYEIVFKSIEGDFDNINGHWIIKDSVNSGITINFEIHYNLGIPVIEEVLGHVLREKMKLNIDKMMDAVKKELGANAADERRFRREAVGREESCLLNGRPLRIFVMNASAGGMMTHFLPDIAKGGKLSIGSVAVEVEAVYANEAQNRSHFVFRKPLEEESLKRFLAMLTAGSGRLQLSTSKPQEATVYCDEQQVPIKILDLTREGMSLFVQGDIMPAMEMFTISNTSIPVKEVIRDLARNTMNVRFSNLLNDEQFRWMREQFNFALNS